ncbi:chemotaxis protein, partial [Helicobacter sp. MIT 11-5569]|uniref:cache domain-containing protein n=1 Tax=Helicobacter sp. MIT 11-5569 TaxID=1548151 RepID=UPI001107A656
MYKNLSLKTKIMVLALGMLIGLAIAIGIVMYYGKSMVANTRVAIDNGIRQEVEQKLKLATDSLANSLGELVQGVDEESQIQIIAKSIEKFRFEDDKSGYYFAYKEHTPVAHPTRKDLIGKSLYETKDVNGVYYVRELFETAKTQDKETKFVYFTFSKPLPDGTLGTAQKIGYAAMIPNTDNIWLSTGVYTDTLATHTEEISYDIVANLRATLLKSFGIGIIFFFVIMIPILWAFYNNLIKSVRVVQANLRNFFSFINNNSTNTTLITLNSNDEFGAMAKEINANIQNIQQGLKQDETAIT